MAAEFDECGLWTSYDEGGLNIVLKRKKKVFPEPYSSLL